MKKIRNIIWDLDNTIWFYQEDHSEIVCRELGIENVKEYCNQWLPMFQNMLSFFKEQIVTYSKLEKYIEKQMPILGINGITAQQLLEANQHTRLNCIIPNFEAIEFFKYISQKKVKNIAITDWFTEEQKKLLEYLNLLKNFDEVHGCDNTYFKNSASGVFRISNILDIRDEDEFVFVGDTLVSDIYLANQLGIKGIWYNPDCKKNNTNHKPYAEIRSLIELKEILEF